MSFMMMALDSLNSDSSSSVQLKRVPGLSSFRNVHPVCHAEGIADLIGNSKP